jgi:hypothetical protein
MATEPQPLHLSLPRPFPPSVPGRFERIAAEHFPVEAGSTQAAQDSPLRVECPFGNSQQKTATPEAKSTPIWDSWIGSV